MNSAEQHNIGSFITSRYADEIDVTAAGAGDNTLSSGKWLDRTKYRSAKLVVSWTATLAAAATLTLTIGARDASDTSGTGAATYTGPKAGTGNSGAFAIAVVATGPGGGGTLFGTTEVDFNLEGANVAIQSRITPDLSAGSTDTARISAVWIFGGGEVIPVV